MRTGHDDINTSIMAVGAHADDIEIGVGGTLEKYHRCGYEIVYVMSTNNMSGSVSVYENGERKRMPPEPNTKMTLRRKRECDDAAAEFGAKPIHLDYPQRHYLDENCELVKLHYGSPVPGCIEGDVPSIITAGEEKDCIERMMNLILEKNPEVILTHPLATYNPEHWGTAMLVANGYWKAVEKGFRGALLHWLEPETRFGPFYHRWETYVDISPYLDRKMELIGKHKCQMPTAHLPDFGHRVLAQEYGKSCGCLAAECFIWIRRSTHVENLMPVYGSLMLELVRNTK